MDPNARDIAEYKITVEAEDILFSYPTNSGKNVVAVDHASFSIKKGEYVAILGRNGSGKSTLAKMVNLLETPDAGKLSVFEISADDDENFWKIRSHCGMVFQNPDNQIVGTTVEEDVAFGPENLSVPLPELAQRVEKALGYVGLLEKADKQPSSAPGRQNASGQGDHGPAHHARHARSVSCGQSDCARKGQDPLKWHAAGSIFPGGHDPKPRT